MCPANGGTHRFLKTGTAATSAGIPKIATVIIGLSRRFAQDSKRTGFSIQIRQAKWPEAQSRGPENIAELLASNPARPLPGNIETLNQHRSVLQMHVAGAAFSAVDPWNMANVIAGRPWRMTSSPLISSPKISQRFPWKRNEGFSSH